MFLFLLFFFLFFLFSIVFDDIVGGGVVLNDGLENFRDLEMERRER